MGSFSALWKQNGQNKKKHNSISVGRATSAKYELESGHIVEDNIKIAILVNNLKGPVPRQNLLLNVAPTTTWKKVQTAVHNDF